jgi:hypothetical protein
VRRHNPENLFPMRLPHVITGPQDLKTTIPHKQGMHQILFSPTPLLLHYEFLRVFVGQEDIVRVDQHTWPQPRQNLQVEIHYISAAPNQMTGIDEQYITGIQSLGQFESGQFLDGALNEFTRRSMDLNPWGRIDTDELRRQVTILYRAGRHATRVPTPNLDDLRRSKLSHDPIKNVGIDRLEPPILTEEFAVSNIPNRQSCQL